MAKKPLPTPELLRQRLRYDPETGFLFWRETNPDAYQSDHRSAAAKSRMFNVRWAGKRAFAGLNSDQYWSGRIGDLVITAHRVAWAMHYGEWASGQIDHINGDKQDNRMANLRSCSHLENGRNAKMHTTNTSGFNGVGFHKMTGKWAAYIRDKGRHKHIGLYERKEDAFAARKEAERRIGYHPNHGRA